MLHLCNDRYEQLLSIGVDEYVAADRVFDAYECAYLNKPTHCFDRRDRLFENQLRSIVYQHQAS